MKNVDVGLLMGCNDSMFSPKVRVSRMFASKNYSVFYDSLTYSDDLSAV